MPFFFTFLVVVGMAIAIEEYAASLGPYRLTIWDRLTSNVKEIPAGRAQVSLQVAIQLCRQRASSDLGSSLLMSKFDQRASRYDLERKVHTIFLDLTLKGSEREQIYIRCDVSAVERTILESRIKGISSFFGFSL